MSSESFSFSTDFKTLKTDATKFEGIQTDALAAKAAYTTTWGGLLEKAKGDSQYLLVLIIYLLMNQGQNEMDTHLAVQGSSLKIQGDITALSNDLENLSNSNSPDPSRLVDYTKHLNSMLEVLNNGQDSPSWSQDVQNALNADGSQQSTSSYLFQNFLALRHQVYWSWSKIQHCPDYNLQGAIPSSSGPRSYYFDPSDPVNPQFSRNSKPSNLIPYGPNHDTYHISNFADLQAYMQEPGDLDRATEAAKAKTDQFNMITATTQSTNAASDALISQEKNLISTVTSFTTDLMHSMMDTDKASINNQVSR